MAQLLSALPNGAKVEFITFLGEKVKWRKIGSNLSGMPGDSTTLVTDQIIALRPFDAKEPSNSNSNRKNYGNNDYTKSNIRQWLNSTAAAGGWYSAQHSADAPPSEANVYSGYNDYQSDAGFLNGATAQERESLLSTTRRIGGYSGNGTSCTDKVFLLTTNELGLESIADNGTKIAYFSDNASRIASVSTKAASDSEYSVTANNNWYYWTATSYPSFPRDVRLVSPDGALSYNYACYGYNGVRPACNLSSNILVSDSTGSSGCYTIVYNSAPTNPPTITVPSAIQSTVKYTVEWGQSSDTDGNLSGYTLQRNVNGSGSWTQSYKGSSRTFQDSVPFGTTKVQYRVQAYDSDGATSGWTTSETRTVTNNRAPAISGTDRDLGTFSGNIPKLDYTVTDEDGDSVTVVEYVDGSQVNSYTAQLGQVKSLTFTPDAWTQVLNGSHTLRVTATDPSKASATRECTFTKTVGKVDFTVKTDKNFDTDAMPTMAVFNVQGSFPAGSTLTVYACNNADDAEPTWQDVSTAVRNGQKVFFDNTDKTADHWSVGVHVVLERGTAQGDVYITSIGGNFR